MTNLADVSDLRSRIAGEVIGPEDPEYDEARSVYNAMIDRRPTLVARCRGLADVQAAIEASRRNRLDLAVRGGGHNGPGFGTVDGGVVIDLSPMHDVEIDPSRRTVRVQGGATWKMVDTATAIHGLATPAGIISTTGVGGLTLGGGHGYLTRRYGLTIDNLLEAEVVLADGRVVTASESEHPDLFWALRGGGGNFGVVTSFTFRLHPVSTVVGGPTAWPLSATPEVLKWFRDFLPAQDPELYGFFATMTVPPVDGFPEAFHLHKACAIVWCYSGDPADAHEALSPVRDLSPRVRRDRRSPLRRPATSLRCPLPARLAVVLEGRLFPQRSGRSGNRPPTTLRGPAHHALDHASLSHRRRCQPGPPGCHRICVSGRHLLPGHRRRRSRPCERARHQTMGRRLLGGHPPILGWRRLRELHDGRRGSRPCPRHLWAQLRPTGPDQG